MDRPRAPDLSLLERTDELGAITAAVAGLAERRAGVVVVEGPAGIGKSALLAFGAERARSAGAQVLTAGGSELERALPVGLARRLLGGAAAANAPVGAAAEEAPFAALQALAGTVARLAEARPLALVVDDAHWADAGSLRFLNFLAPRLDGLGVLLIVAVRTPLTDEDWLVRRLLATPGVVSLMPGALSRAGVGELVAQLAGDVGEEAVDACYAATGGNPFFAREHALWGSEAATRTRVTRAIAVRIDRAGGRRLARAVAVLGGPATLREAAALADLDPAQAARTADALRSEGILQPAAGLGFAHPIVGAAVLDGMPAGERGLLHDRAARRLFADGAAADRVAGHLLCAEPAGDPWASERLREAARLAVDGGAPEAAVRYLRRALAEPPLEATRSTVTLELGVAEVLAHDPAGVEHMRRALADPDVGAQRAPATRLLAHALTHLGRGAEALALLEEPDSDADPTRRADLEAELVAHGRFALATRRTTLALAGRLVERDPVDGATAVANRSVELIMGNRDRGDAIALARRALGGTPLDALSQALALRVLVVSDDLDEAGRIAQAAIDDARSGGRVVELNTLLTIRADRHLRAGSVFDAEVDARAAWEMARAHEWPMGLPAAASQLVAALVARGELDEALEVIARSGLDAAPEELAELYTSSLLLEARGALGLARGDVAGAAADLQEVGRRQRDWQEHNPATIAWRSLLAAALAASGEPDPARALAAEELELARAFGAPRAISVALVAGAALERPAVARPLLVEAVGVLGDGPVRLQRARALAALGRAELRDGEVARAQRTLLAARDLAHRCGATALEHDLGSALREAGLRPRRPQLSGPASLTPSELRVAQMAAAGHSNREIAEALYVTIRTVEWHLTAGYRKLAIQSRRELPAALAPAPPRAGAPAAGR